MIILDAKTDYSFMRGYGTPEQWLARCRAVGVTTFGVADYCSTWGHAPFKEAFKGSGIKLLYGARVPVVSLLDKDPRHSLVILIAKERTDELYAAMTQAQAQTYYRPRLTWRQVAELKDCVIIVDHLLRSHRRSVPAGAFASINIEHNSLPRLLTYGPCYPTPEDHISFEIFQSVSEGNRLGEIEQEPIHLLRQRELVAKFGNFDEAALQAIADLCTAEPPHGALLNMGVSDKGEQLRTLALTGAIKLGLAGLDQGDSAPRFFDRQYADRLDRELEVILDKDFADYFFFVADIVRWAKERMFVGPGRGSAGGSLLCYLLGITTVDPLRFGTMFERFIDVTRSDLPDIDLDFPDTRRDEVFAYLREKYGSDHVARLGTLSLLGGKSAINLVGRAKEIPFEVTREIGKWTEGVGQGMVISPEWIYEHVEEVQPLLTRHPALRLACNIDGHVSHHGVHASGVVVTDPPVRVFGSVSRDGILSMDMRTAESIGLVKLDALGLRTLSVIQETCDLIGINPTDLYGLDWNDKAVLDGVFNADRVTGVFQFEGHATRSLMKQVRVDKFDDLCALTSLSRPGPLVGGAAAGWVKARNGEAIGDLLHPALEETHGVICYQEQFMAIARDVAGFDVPQVNGMRRAVAKKDPEKLRGFRDNFIAGTATHFARKRGRDMGFENADADRAAALWEEICEFGSYAFNKAHAVAYSMISFMCAYLKHKYPLQFAVAQLRNAADDDQIKALLRELTEEGYKYVPFDIVRSCDSWNVLDGVLYGGFDSIRGIGTKTAARLVERRNRSNSNSSWLHDLTEAQRKRIEKAELRWSSISYFTEKFSALYKSPSDYKTPATPKGIRPPVYRIRDIPDQKGNYAFLGRVVSAAVVDDDAPERVAKRDGKKRGKDHLFINLKVEDDTGEVSGTVSRFKFEEFRWIAEAPQTGKDFLFRANLIEAGRRWLFFENIIELKEGKANGQGMGSAPDDLPEGRFGDDGVAEGTKLGGLPAGRAQDHSGNLQDAG